jgi:light-regulated signal transduction histidine kinase (bacteriophytochrome)
MKAKKGEWFSLSWDITDKFDPIAWEQFKKCPRFLYAEEDSLQIEGKIINEYDRLRLTSIFLTSMFLKNDDGLKVPTHYRVGVFMPGDNVGYDKWIKDYHRLNQEVTEQIRAKEMLQQKSIYLEHAARIIRHDMHSGINTYIPRGLKSLLDKLPEETIEKHKLGLSIRLLQEGLNHAQRVYQGVYAFTNLVKDRGQIEKEELDIKEVLTQHLSTNAYSHMVEIEDCGKLFINRSLFCTAVENFVKNGIAYNSSGPYRKVRIYKSYENEITIEDNGIGLTQQQYDIQTMPFLREEVNNINQITGLGINIANAILIEHGFRVKVDRLTNGTAIRIILKN